ncbi:TadE/TadG family type IV pilus assembly protein [Falsiroseomonas sp. E2-1-a4]|uniref:TadE/TadG family type IV pilus assembly protein n=1 Tax=Falsiroseomonas sp. E2-1-a4 TaxID=3239299 RepID=UPI003F3CE6AD
MSSSRRGRLTESWQNCRGTVAIEFALVGLIFITLLLGAVDLARFQSVRQSLGNVAEEAARAAMIMSGAGAVLGGGCTTTPDGGVLKSAVTTPVNPTPMLTPALLTITPVCALSAGGARTITVTATYPFNFVAPLLTVAPTLSATASLTY